MSDANRIARVAKGKRPAYFGDPAVDKLHAIVMTLVAELSVTRDRLDALERLLEQRGSIEQSDLDSYVPNPAAESERRERREDFIRRVMRVVEMEIAEVAADDSDRSFDALLERFTRD